jgi:hypothetical protein
MAIFFVFGDVGSCLFNGGALIRSVFNAYAVVMIFLGPGGRAVLFKSLCTFA